MATTNKSCWGMSSGPRRISGLRIVMRRPIILALNNIVPEGEKYLTRCIVLLGEENCVDRAGYRSSMEIRSPCMWWKMISRSGGSNAWITLELSTKVYRVQGRPNASMLLMHKRNSTGLGMLSSVLRHLSAGELAEDFRG